MLVQLLLCSKSVLETNTFIIYPDLRQHTYILGVTFRLEMREYKIGLYCDLKLYEN